ncbi:MAG: YARHG domain-containing protein [Ignavibacteria bacterium]|nr:YARHG domain-containing protein [Ignavibacteria bacterium]
MKTIAIIVLFIFFVSCTKQQEQNSESFNSSERKNRSVEVESSEINSDINNQKIHEQVIGSYTGKFIAKVYDRSKNYVYANKITIFIDSLNDEIMYGHSVVAGNNRPFKGKYVKIGENYEADVAEPGDDKYDGKFSFTVIIDTKNTNEIFLKGIWEAYDKKLPVSVREYNLEKKSFAYNPHLELPQDVKWAELYDANPEFPERIEMLTNEVVKYNASVMELKKEHLQNLYKGDLEIIRNAIYARHGYSFKNRRVRFIFDKFVTWYMPVSTDIRNQLTELEKKNIELIKRYEEHAEKYYDVFGR